MSRGNFGLFFLLFLTACQPEVVNNDREDEAGYQFAYITNNNNANVNQGTLGLVQVVNTDGMNLTVPGGIGVGENPDGIAIHPDGQWVYAANTYGGAAGQGTVSVINAYTNTVAYSFYPFNNPKRLGVSADGTALFVVDLDESAKPRLNSYRVYEGYSYVQSLSVTYGGSDIHLTRDGQYLISLGGYGLSIVSLDASDAATMVSELTTLNIPLTKLKDYTAPDNYSILDARGMAVDELNGWLYIANSAGWEVLAVNYLALIGGSFNVDDSAHFKTALVETTGGLPPKPYDVVVDETDSLLYVSVSKDACNTTTSCSGAIPNGFIKVFSLSDLSPYSRQNVIPLLPLSLPWPDGEPTTHPMAIDMSASDNVIYVISSEWGQQSSYYLMPIVKKYDINNNVSEFSLSNRVSAVGAPVSAVGPFIGPYCPQCPIGEINSVSRARVKASLGVVVPASLLGLGLMRIVARRRRQYNTHNS